MYMFKPGASAVFGMVQIIVKLKTGYYIDT